MDDSDKAGSDVSKILDIDSLCPFQASDFPLEEVYACLLLGVLRLEAVKIRRLGSQLGR